MLSSCQWGEEVASISYSGGFARISNNVSTILGYNAEHPEEAQQAIEIAEVNLSNDRSKRRALIIGNDAEHLEEAQKALEIVEANLSKARTKRQVIEANLTLERARTWL